jgi:hypothetical protein
MSGRDVLDDGELAHGRGVAAFWDTLPESVLPLTCPTKPGLRQLALVQPALDAEQRGVTRV